ncbi:MAG: SLC13 family permease, partial [Proteobacteria bacterium]
AESTSLAGEENNILEAVIGPKSNFIGKSLSQIGFYDKFGVVVVAIWRKSGWIREKLSQTVLSEGDLIVLWGPQDKLEALSEHQGFLVFMPFHGKAKKRIRIPVALSIMGISILVASFGWLPAHIAFLTGAMAMILSGCVNVENAYSAIETKVFVMIAGVIPLGLAMQKVGFDKLAADLISNWTQALDPFWTMMLFFWFAALLTQIMSDAATTVLIAPIAVAFAKATGFSPVATVVCVTIGAIASFLTPIGHHGNLIVLNPGGYKFSDFLKIGFPLTVVISLITCYLSLRIWT